MGVHNKVIGVELKRKDVLGYKVENFMTLEQLATIYDCSVSNVKQNIIKINRTTKRERFPKVDWVILFPSDLMGKGGVKNLSGGNENEDRYIVCNSRLLDLLMERSIFLGKDLETEARKRFSFIKG